MVSTLSFQHGDLVDSAELQLHPMAHSDPPAHADSCNTILFASELGGGFGHVTRMLPIATAMAAKGYSPVFVVPNPVEVESLLSGHAFPYLQAPRIERRREWKADGPRVVGSFSDILALAGFAEDRVLLATLNCWQALLDLAKPCLVVCEYSPFLCLAALERPLLVLGNGFTLPPPELSEFPTFADQPPQLESTAILDAVARVQRYRNRPVPPTLPSILKGSRHLVCSLAELDPYLQLRQSAPCGPPILVDSASSHPASKDLFAYLAGESPWCLAIARALKETGLSGFVYARNLPADLNKILEGSALQLLSSPTSISKMLQKSSIVLHHGGMGLAEEALIAGRPQIVLPLYLEQYLTAKRIESAGVGTVVPTGSTAATMVEQFRRTATDPRYRAIAVNASEIIRARYGSGSLDLIVQNCLDLIQQR